MRLSDPNITWSPWHTQAPAALAAGRSDHSMGNAWGWNGSISVALPCQSP